MLNIFRAVIPALLTAAGAYVLAPPLLGRYLSIGEDLLCGGFVWVVVGCIQEYRRRQEYRRLLSMRGSALW